MPRRHTIQPGESAVSLAFEEGLYWKTLWDHDENAALRELRKDPAILKPGDVLYVPDIATKEEPIEVGKTCQFRRKGVPSRLKIRLMAEASPAAGTPPELEEGYFGASGEADGSSSSTPPQPEASPLAGVSCIVDIDGKRTTLQSDADGYIEITVPPNAQHGVLILQAGTDEERTLELAIGHLRPLSELSGVKERLANLSLYRGPLDDEATPALEEAVRQFQRRYGLEETGAADEATRTKLEEVYGE